jgi:hypothetical protein
MDGTRDADERQGDEDDQKQRIERERQDASDAEREAADGPGYTARPAEGGSVEGPKTAEEEDEASRKRRGKSYE